jgi:hypothetical protein
MNGFQTKLVTNKILKENIVFHPTYSVYAIILLELKMLSYLENMNKPIFMEVWLWSFQRLQITTIMMDPNCRLIVCSMQ